MGIAYELPLSDDNNGKWRYFRLEPPLCEEDWQGEIEEYEYVIVSAAYARFSGPETFIFPALDGDISDFAELSGSFRGDLDHERALRNAGYEIDTSRMDAIDAEVIAEAAAIEAAPMKALEG